MMVVLRISKILPDLLVLVCLKPRGMKYFGPGGTGLALPPSKIQNGIPMRPTNQRHVLTTFEGFFGFEGLLVLIST